MKASALLLATLLLTACGNRTETAVITQLDGSPFMLEEAIAGKPTIINFWASWCPFCKTELPAFQSVSDEHSELEVIAINLQEDKEVAEQYWQNGGYTFTRVLDPNAELKAKFKVFTQPTTIFIDERGEIIERRDGPLTEIGRAHV